MEIECIILKDVEKEFIQSKAMIIIYLSRVRQVFSPQSRLI